MRVRAGVEDLATEPPPGRLVEVQHRIVDADHDVVRLRHLRQGHPQTHAARASRDPQARFRLAPPHPKLSDHLPCLFRELEHQPVSPCLYETARTTVCSEAREGLPNRLRDA
jgi:hypothetical protein